MKIYIIAGALASMVAIPAPVLAEPSIGFGVSYVFGGGGGGGGVAVGARIFSTDQPDKAAVGLGIDYNISSGTWRPNVGVAYLQDDIYMDLSLGLSDGFVDYGVGIGVLGGME